MLNKRIEIILSIITLILIINPLAQSAQVESKATQVNLIARIKERYKKNTKTPLKDLEHELLIAKKYGPELADLLDLSFGVFGYIYKGQGIYDYPNGQAVHSYPRHCCEEGVTEAIATKAHEKLEPPSYISPDGTRHIAFMH